MEDFKHFGGGVNARQVDSKHVEVANSGNEEGVVLNEDDLAALTEVDGGAIIVGDDVVADAHDNGLVTLREADGEHIVTIGQGDDVPQMREMLQEPEVVLVSEYGAEVYITDFDAVNVKTQHGGETAEMKAEFDDDVRHPDSPRIGNSTGVSDTHDRSWFFTEVREP